jgi:hypothetical protein
VENAEISKESARLPIVEFVKRDFTRRNVKTATASIRRIVDIARIVIGGIVVLVIITLLVTGRNSKTSMINMINMKNIW